MSKYKVGDVVKVRNDLENGKTYGRESFIEDGMSIHLGKNVTIERLLPDGYYIKEDKEINWEYTDEMFEDAMKYEVGQVLEDKDVNWHKIVMLAYDTFYITKDSDDGSLGAWTQEELEEDEQWKPVSTTKEVTLEEVAKAMNIPLKDLRIKDK